MWHLKTKFGIFWVVPISEVKTTPQYLLGIDDSELAFYTDAEQAAKDVHDQATGFLKWDIQAQVKAPDHITEWTSGEPQNWYKS